MRAQLVFLLVGVMLLTFSAISAPSSSAVALTVRQMDTGRGLDVVEKEVEAYASGLIWEILSVDDTADVGIGSSLALSRDGFAHVSYYDKTNKRLKYAWQDASGWHREFVTSDPIEIGQTTSLVLDSDGRPHMSYHDKTNEAVKYAHKGSSGWHIETVSTGTGADGGYVALALDVSARPHISYYRSTSYTAGELKYAAKGVSGWQIETVDDSGKCGMYSSLVLDASGYPQISYRDASAGKADLKFARKDASGWHLETPYTLGNVGYNTSLALDTAGNPHISHYMQAPESILEYTYRDASGWHTKDVAWGGSLGGSSPSLAVSSSGRPYIAFYWWPYGQGPRAIYYAQKNAAGWQLDPIVDPGGRVDVSLALFDGKHPVVSYYNQSRQTLEIARGTALSALYLPLVVK